MIPQREETVRNVSDWSSLLQPSGFTELRKRGKTKVIRICLKYKMTKRDTDIHPQRERKMRERNIEKDRDTHKHTQRQRESQREKDRKISVCVGCGVGRI